MDFRAQFALHHVADAIDRIADELDAQVGLARVLASRVRSGSHPITNAERALGAAKRAASVYAERAAKLGDAIDELAVVLHAVAADSGQRV